MPAEVRYIVFSADEVTSAIESYARGMFPDFPSGPVLEMETIGDEDPSVTVLIRERQTQFTQVRIATQELLSFLIRACRDGRVPLPARTSKRLCVLNGQLAISILLDRRQYRSAAEAKPRVRPISTVGIDLTA